MSAETQELSVLAPQSVAFSSPVALMSFDDVSRMAEVVVRGGLFQHLKTPQQALTLMLLAQAEGLHPIDAVRRYDIINGRPAMKAAAMQAEFQRRGGRIEFHERTDTVCDATFVHGGSSVRVKWDMKRADVAGLTSKPGPWKQFPAAMLHARCVSEGVRAVLPAVSVGLYTPEEVQDMAPVHPPAPPLRSAAPAPAIEPAKPGAVLPHVGAMDEYGQVASKHEEIPTIANGRLSAKALKESAIRVLGQGAETLDWTSPDPWVAAKIALVEKLSATVAVTPEPATPAKAAGQPMRRTTPEPAGDDLANIEDPFADN